MSWSKPYGAGGQAGMYKAMKARRKIKKSEDEFINIVREFLEVEEGDYHYEHYKLGLDDSEETISDMAEYFFKRGYQLGNQN